MSEIKLKDKIFELFISDNEINDIISLMAYNINEERQKMVNGWPSEVCCERALYDWDWKAKYNLDNAFSEYFIPYLKSKAVNS